MYFTPKFFVSFYWDFNAVLESIIKSCSPYFSMIRLSMPLNIGSLELNDDEKFTNHTTITSFLVLYDDLM